MLPDPGRKTQTFLAQRYALTELPAAILLLTNDSKREPGDPRVLAFAPSRSGLQFAIPEAQDVAKIFAPYGDLVSGRSATESRFKTEAPRYGIIHVATHGIFDKINPTFSGLQLEADSKNDGRLEVHEILELRLNARLVTLSACDTALGSSDFDEIPAGDEFVGLNRAFLEAGSDAVLASLWKVNDRSTSIMMKRLYHAIAAGTGVSALAEAQREMIKDTRYKHPYYWASFVFIGKDFSFSRTLAEKR